MEEESRRQANVWAAKLGLSLSDFCGHAIASECVNRDLAERDALKTHKQDAAQRRKEKRYENIFQVDIRASGNWNQRRSKLCNGWRYRA